MPLLQFQLQTCLNLPLDYCFGRNYAVLAKGVDAFSASGLQSPRLIQKHRQAMVEVHPHCQRLPHHPLILLTLLGVVDKVCDSLSNRRLTFIAGLRVITAR